MNKLRFRKIVAVYLIINMLNYIITPNVALALTSGPSSPEFSSFEPVATTDMVDVTSGDFIYNLPVVQIPGPDGAGYAMSLSYHSGVSSEEEASWVGFGWTLSPGAINRGKNGYPDDYKDVPVETFNNMRPNWSTSAVADVSLEIMSKDKSKGEQTAQSTPSDPSSSTPSGSAPPSTQPVDESVSETPSETKYKPAVSFNASRSVRFNNYKGIARTTGFGMAVAGVGSVSANFSGGDVSFSGRVSAFDNVGQRKLGQQKQELIDADKAKAKDQRNGKEYKKQMRSINRKMNRKSSLFSNVTRFLGSSTYVQAQMPISVSQYTGQTVNFSASARFQIGGPFGIEAGFTGNANTQIFDRTTTEKVFGYNYLNHWTTSDHNVADIHLEREDTYSARNKYLGIPYNAPDNYSVSGEGIGGSFRFYHTQVGTLSPRKIDSFSTTSTVGFELGFGETVSGGLDLGIGVNTSALNHWGNEVASDKALRVFDVNKTPIIRFANDASSRIDYQYVGGYQVSDPYGGIKYSQDRENMELKNGYTNSSIYVQAQTVGQVNSPSITSSATNNDLLATMTMVGNDGSTHVYGLPTYVKDEHSLAFLVNGSKGYKSPYGMDGTLADNFIFYPNSKIKLGGNILNNTTLQGTKSTTPYASAFLLTQINTYDYVDIGNNGPDNADFGGWTKFSYRKWAKNGGWSRYRSPYNGLFYNKGLISNTQDDMGQFSDGLKEVYYMKAVETKTHIAFFVTNKTIATDFSEYVIDEQIRAKYLVGSGKVRKDALGAPNVDPNDPASMNTSLTEQQKIDLAPEYLEKIVMFKKGEYDKPLRVTRFEYDYSLCKGAPNAESGKLTLKKVWFESFGVVEANIAPYEFKYSNRTSFPSALIGPNGTSANYQNVAQYASNFKDIHQNPDYKPYALDPWGNYQNDGVNRHKYQMDWVSQKPDNTFDPAPWTLKEIILPSGGSIIVQYEQDDYSYVQDKEALGMVSLKKDGSLDNYADENQEVMYSINTDDINLSPSEVDAYVEKLKRYFYKRQNDSESDPGEPLNQVYFKMLYKIEGGDKPSMDDCKSEYIEGWTSVYSVIREQNTNNIFIKLGRNSQWKERKDRKHNSPPVPKRICYEFRLNEVEGFMEKDDCSCDFKSYTHTETKIRDSRADTDPATKGRVALNSAIGEIPSLFDLLFTSAGPAKKNVCKEIDYEHSYVRVPLPKSKKGGGVRVKRLLMLDNGIEENDAGAVLFGSEYLYVNPDGSSSGVASNEPAGVGNENALVSLLADRPQSFAHRIIAGKSREELEGPIGSSLLPPATVIYGRVVVKNIYDGISTTGFTVQEFYTHKDDPMKASASILRDNRKRFKLPLTVSLVTIDISAAAMSQDYTIDIGDLAGKQKKVSNYEIPYPSDHIITASPTSYTQYEYFKRNEKVKYVTYDKENNYNRLIVTPTIEHQGMQEDVCVEARRVHEINSNVSVEIDLSLICSVLTPTVGVMPTIDFSDKQISVARTSTVRRHTSILKKVTSYSDGMTTVNEHILFDKNTGNPVMSSTTESFSKINLANTDANGLGKGTYYSWTFPAYWMYSELGFKSINPAYSNQLSASVASITTYGKDGNWDGISALAEDKKISTTPNPDDYYIDFKQLYTSKGVINASATCFKKGWYTADIMNELMPDASTDQKAALSTLNAFYRPLASYTYSGVLAKPNDNVKRVYNTGLINYFKMFDWSHTGLNSQYLTDQTTSGTDKWMLASQLITYSLHGMPVEERDMMGIHSAVRYGYNNTLPVMVAQNANFTSIFFQDFENLSAATKLNAHSGYKSMHVNSTGNKYTFINSAADMVKLSTQMNKHGAKVKMWVYGYNTTKSTHVDVMTAQPMLVINSSIKIPCKQIANVGEWTLIEADITNWGTITDNQKLDVSIEFTPRETADQLYIDDVRFQPNQSAATCSVYDHNLRVVAQFDDEHFGVLYKYNEEGQLLRKQIETERGIKMIQESQSNTPRKTLRKIQ